MEATAAFCDWTERPVDLLMVDLMFTVLILRSKKSRKTAICAIYRQIGRLPDDVTDDVIWRKINEVRHRYAAIKDDERFWYFVNMIALEELIVDGRVRQHANSFAKEIHREILTNEELYAFQPSMIDMLAWVRKRGVRVVIVSNQKEEYASAHLDHFGIRHAFDAAYYSGDLGVKKPHPEIWQMVLGRESELLGREIDPARAVHLGNSANSDAGAARLGIPVMLYDRYGELRQLAEGDLSGLDIPEQDPVELYRLLASGIVSVHRDIASLRNVLRQRVYARLRS